MIKSSGTEKGEQIRGAFFHSMILYKAKGILLLENIVKMYFTSLLAFTFSSVTSAQTLNCKIIYESISQFFASNRTIPVSYAYRKGYYHDSKYYLSIRPVLEHPVAIGKKDATLLARRLESTLHFISRELKDKGASEALIGQMLRGTLISDSKISIIQSEPIEWSKQTLDKAALMPEKVFNSSQYAGKCMVSSSPEQLIVKLTPIVIRLESGSYSLFDPKLDHVAGIEEIRKAKSLSYLEEYLHLLQILKDYSGKSYAISKAFQNSTVQDQVFAASKRAEREDPLHYMSPWEADVYARLIEDFGTHFVPNWYGKRYPERAVIDDFYRTN